MEAERQYEERCIRERKTETEADEEQCRAHKEADEKRLKAERETEREANGQQIGVEQRADEKRRKA